MTRILALAGVASLAFAGTAIAQQTADPTDAGAPAGDQSLAPTTDPTADAQVSPETMSRGTGTGTTPPAAPAQAPATGADMTPQPPEPGMTPDAPAAPTTPMASTAAPMKTASADATAKVQSGWATYDKGKKGSLTALEFGTWIMAANGQDMTAQVEKSKTARQANLPAVKVLNATASEFAKADVDSSKSISPEELAAYLS